MAIKTHTYKIVDVDARRGHMVLEFDDEPMTRANYDIPVDSAGDALTGQALQDYVAEMMYEHFKRLDSRTKVPDYDAWKRSEMTGASVDITAELQAIELVEKAELPP